MLHPKQGATGSSSISATERREIDLLREQLRLALEQARQSMLDAAELRKGAELSLQSFKKLKEKFDKMKAQRDALAAEVKKLSEQNAQLYKNCIELRTQVQMLFDEMNQTPAASRKTSRSIALDKELEDKMGAVVRQSESAFEELKATSAQISELRKRVSTRSVATLNLPVTPRDDSSGKETELSAQLSRARAELAEFKKNDRAPALIEELELSKARIQELEARIRELTSKVDVGLESVNTKVITTTSTLPPEAVHDSTLKSRQTRKGGAVTTTEVNMNPTSEHEVENTIDNMVMNAVKVMSRPVQNLPSIPGLEKHVTKIQANVYRVCDQRVTLTFHDRAVLVRIGGGFIEFGAWCDKHRSRLVHYMNIGKSLDEDPDADLKDDIAETEAAAVAAASIGSSASKPAGVGALGKKFSTMVFKSRGKKGSAPEVRSGPLSKLAESEVIMTDDESSSGAPLSNVAIERTSTEAIKGQEALNLLEKKREQQSAELVDQKLSEEKRRIMEQHQVELSRISSALDLEKQRQQQKFQAMLMMKRETQQQQTPEEDAQSRELERLSDAYRTLQQKHEAQQKELEQLRSKFASTSSSSSTTTTTTVTKAVAGVPKAKEQSTSVVRLTANLRTLLEEQVLSSVQDLSDNINDKARLQESIQELRAYLEDCVDHASRANNQAESVASILSTTQAAATPATASPATEPQPFVASRGPLVTTFVFSSS